MLMEDAVCYAVSDSFIGYFFFFYEIDFAKQIGFAL